MRILIGLIKAGQPGGIYVTEHAMIEALRNLPGVTVRIKEFGARSEAEHLFQRLAGRVLDLLRLARLLTVDRPDLVHINSAYTRRGVLRDVAYAAICRLWRVPLFVKMHGSTAALLATRRSHWRILTLILFRLAWRIELLSKEECRNFEAAGLPQAKTVLVRNCVDLKRFSSAAAAPPFSPPAVLFIARFIRPKGLLDLLHATRSVLDAGHAMRLICVGDGPIRAEAEELARELRLGEAVTFTGQISEQQATEFYCRSSILALPTYHEEGWPMTILQALAAGLPVVTTRIRAAADYLEEPTNCLWVQPRDPGALAENLIRLLSDPQLRESMAVANRGLAGSFGADRVAREYYELFRDLPGHG